LRQLLDPRFFSFLAGGAHLMFDLALLTVKGVFRDKVFRGILMTGLVFLILPSISSLSMRQVTELSLTLSLSLISFILLLLSVFLGGTSLWKDLERRYTINIASLPLTRSAYVLGKFTGIAGFILLTTLLLGFISNLVVWYVSRAYPPDIPVVWKNVYLAILFDGMKYILLVSCTFFLSSVSTSFFLPIFGAISVFLVGSASQEAYEYIQSAASANIPNAVKYIVKLLYYILPNFSAFDLNVNAIYGISLSSSGLALTVAYFIVYVAIVMTLAAIIFSRREIQ
jgi:ABC-type transport system involved in multi-copper enzyme maturation permease subunit